MDEMWKTRLGVGQACNTQMYLGRRNSGYKRVYKQEYKKERPQAQLQPHRTSAPRPGTPPSLG